jgi:hypothetical protein
MPHCPARRPPPVRATIGTANAMLSIGVRGMPDHGLLQTAREWFHNELQPRPHEVRSPSWRE